MYWLNRTIRQDRNLDNPFGYSRAVLQDVGSTGAYEQDLPRLNIVRYARAKYEPPTARNIAKTNKLIRLMNEREKVHEDNAKVLFHAILAEREAGRGQKHRKLFR